MIDKRRVRVLREGDYKKGAVVYIMGRDFRAADNWALLYAQECAIAHKAPLSVLVHMGENMLATTKRQHSFFVEGLKETAATLESHNIPFFITYGDWRKEMKEFVRVHEVGLIVTDFSPLHELRWWWDEVSHGITAPIHEVDAHNIIPCWLASPKQEFAAYTFRPKVRKRYREFVSPFPKLKQHPYDWGISKIACWPRGLDKHGCALIDWDGVKKFCTFTAEVPEIKSFISGETAALKALTHFIKDGLKDYNATRNDPTLAGQSGLSPYIRFGQLAVGRIALEIDKVRRDQKSKEAFMEELIVRRELAENYCFYNDTYHSFDGLPPWAKETLNAHRKDKREFTYTLTQFECAATHDPLWNAAERELMQKGKMHGFMRMYWAKKILEWSKSPEEAIETALTLNDRYELDGRDPNGYVGVLWSIGGLHDRAWSERPVFGKIRYMNYNGCKRKFDVKKYIDVYGGTATLF